MKSDTVTHGWSSCYIWFLFIFCRWKNCFIHFKLLFFPGLGLVIWWKVRIMCFESWPEKKSICMVFLKKWYKMVEIYVVNKVGRVAQWIRHQTSNLGIAGSSPAVVEYFFFLVLARAFYDDAAMCFYIIWLIVKMSNFNDSKYLWILNLFC